MIGLCCLFLSIKGDKIDADEQQKCVESCEEDTQERLDDHCYYWSASEQSWQISESLCKSMNGHLAAVTNSEIHNFLMKKATNALKTSFWIGGTDQDREGTWKWTDGSKWEFTKWADQPEQQPSNGSYQNCLQIKHTNHAKNGWNDHWCSYNYRFICSWKICPGIEIQRQ